MNDFSTYDPENVNLDPEKRVNYRHGMVLGVDEFLQEEHYFLERHRLHNRSLHGYGTVCGIALDWEPTSQGPKIKVTSGLAVTPRGDAIRLSSNWCGYIDQWLNNHGDDVQTALGSPPADQVSIYLTLCRSECKTDTVPIPSGPCQSMDETSAPSRISDDFDLKLMTTPPPQVENQAVEALLTVLGRIEITDSFPGLTREQLENIVRHYKDYSSPLSPPDASPPGEDWTLHPDNARDYMKSALRVWVTKVLPDIRGSACHGGPAAPGDDCVLLARLDFEVNLTEAGYRTSGDITIDESERPYLLSYQLLQAYLPALSGTVSGGVSMHDELGGLAGDDHEQYYHIDGRRSLTGNLAAGGNRVADIGNAVDPADAVPLGQLDDRLTQHNATDGDHPQFLLTNGSRPLGADWSVGSHQIKDLADATHDRDAVTLRQLRDRVNDVIGRLENYVYGVAGPYAIVAAGRFRPDGTPNGPVYNGLTATRVNYEGEFNLDFSQYEYPKEHTYVVKGTTEGKELGIFQVIEFEDEFIRVRSLSLKELYPLGFHVEISMMKER